jgi:hypothetical protein
MPEEEVVSVDTWRAKKYEKQEETLSATMRPGGGESTNFALMSVSDFLFSLKDLRYRNQTNPLQLQVRSAGTFNFRPPLWMESKDVAIDGKPLTSEQLRDDKLWDRKYRKELYVGQMIANSKMQKRVEDLNDIWGMAMRLRRWTGLDNPLPETEKLAQQPAAAALEKEREREKRDSEPSVSWSRFVQAVESGKPLAKAGGIDQYRTRIDYYGIDQFLNSPLSFAWLSTKIGACFGMIHGFLRTMKIITVDTQYVHASGIGMMSLLNVSVLAAGMKWAGNLCGASLAFCAGDQLVSAAKYAVMDARDARGRSASNYTVGMACAFACSGVLPWWVLNDGKLAARYAISGAFVGSLVGMLTAVTLERMIAANLAKLDASPRELRRFEAMMGRERFRYLAETDYSKAAIPHMI